MALEFGAQFFGVCESEIGDDLAIHFFNTKITSEDFYSCVSIAFDMFGA
jgi:hypothetical protein